MTFLAVHPSYTDITRPEQYLAAQTPLGPAMTPIMLVDSPEDNQPREVSPRKPDIRRLPKPEQLGFGW